jgi:hypothetical protein
MLRRVIFLSLLVIGLNLTFGTASSRAAQPSNTVSANADFVYRAGDQITDDHQGTYFDGKDGVSCTFHDPALGGSGDLTFHTSSPGGSQSTRTMTFLFGTPLSPCPVTSGGKVPASTQSASLTVSGIYNTFPVGGMIYTRAFFFLTEGTLRFANTNYCANEVMVTHPDPRTYVISTTPAGSSAGNLAVMVESSHGKDAAVFNWQMPFQIAATVQ